MSSEGAVAPYAYRRGAYEMALAFSAQLRHERKGASMRPRLLAFLSAAKICKSTAMKHVKGVTRCAPCCRCADTAMRAMILLKDVC